MVEIFIGLFDIALLDLVGLFDSLTKGLLGVIKFGVLGVPTRNADNSAERRHMCVIEIKGKSQKTM